MDIRDELQEMFATFQLLTQKHKMQGHMFGGHLSDTTRGQGRILAMLKMHDGISTKDLSYLLGIRTSSLNESLSRLEKGGFIKREPSADDKRVMIIKITKAGKEKKQSGNEVSNVFDCLSAEEQEKLRDILGRLIVSMQEHMKDDRPIPDGVADELRLKMGDAIIDHWMSHGGGARGHHHFSHEARKEMHKEMKEMRKAFWKRKGKNNERDN
ncbi:MarR family winged helix-turn-helix transcriptional regulator [Treponema sp. R6D11]